MLKTKRISKAAIAATVGVLLIALIFLIVFFTFQARSPEITVTPKNSYQDTLVVVADIDFEPYSFIGKDGKPAGYDIEMIYALADSMHKNVDIRLMNWNDAIAAIKNGQADLLLGLEYTPRDLPYLELSMPLHNDPFVSFGKKEFSNISELYDKRIAALESSGSYPLFLNPYQLKSRATNYSTYSEAFASVEKGENDYVISRYAVGRRAVARLNDSGIKAVGPALASSYFCLGTQKGNEELIEAVNEAIVKRRGDGTLHALADKWLGRYVEIISVSDFLKQYAYVILVAGSAVIGIFMLFFIYSYRQRLRLSRQEHEGLFRILEYQQLLTEATKGLYENIYEFDMTHGVIVGDSAEQLLEEFGLKNDRKYESLLQAFTEQRVDPEYVEGYLALFSKEKVLSAFEQNVSSLSYEFMMKGPHEELIWMRASARIFFWSMDKSVRMIQYFQNINEEKRRELGLLEHAQRDHMTQLYNKRMTEVLIDQILQTAHPESQHAFFILDIDHFKGVNDTFGHDFGDVAIIEFATTIKKMFRESDIVGRIGGDEFVVFLKNYPDETWLLNTAERLVNALRLTVTMDNKRCALSGSIGIAIYPRDGNSVALLYRNADRALYKAKEQGRNRYFMYDGV